ncbi:MAG: D-alanyl-D-alanine carboxypeptidase family protein [Mycobacterium leprae]
MPALADSPVSHARASILLDGQSGQILYQQNGFAKSYPASTTKLLTALVALEHGSLNQMIRVSDQSVDMPPDSSSCYLERGEQQPLEYLLEGLLLVSGNDCAEAIAEGVSGGKPDQFVAWMNETAKRLGATHSNFTNPHGLHDPNHYTTPFDLALIGRAAVSNPTLLKILATSEFYWPGKSDRNGPYYNHNAMLSTYDGEIGGKNGYTEEAGLTLVSAAKRNGHLLIGVVMGETLRADQYNDMTALLDYGFTSFVQQPAIAAGTSFGSVPVRGGVAKSEAAIVQNGFLVSVPKGGQPTITTQAKLNPELTAPVAAGQELGTLEIRDGDRLLSTVPLVAQGAIAASPYSLRNLVAVSGQSLKWAAVAFFGLVGFRTIVVTTRRRQRRSRRQAALSRSRVAGGNAISSYRPRGR